MISSSSLSSKDNEQALQCSREMNQRKNNKNTTEGRERGLHFVTSKRAITGGWFDATQKLGYPERDGKHDTHTLTRETPLEMQRAKEHVAYSNSRANCTSYRYRVHETRICLSPSNQRSRLVARASVLCRHHVNTQGRELTPNKTKNDAFQKAQIKKKEKEINKLKK